MGSSEKTGRCFPLGARVGQGGTNFSLFSRSATGVELLLFDREGDARPGRVILIDPATNRTYHYWHVFVPGVRPGQIYGYRVEGRGDGSHSVAFGAELRREGLGVHLILNAYWEPLEFELPKLDSGTWQRWIDTALDSPDDITPWEKAPPVAGNTYRVAERSVVMLYATPQG